MSAFNVNVGSEKLTLLLTEREARTGEYWPEVLAIEKRLRANIPQYGSSWLGLVVLYYMALGPCTRALHSGPALGPCTRALQSRPAIALCTRALHSGPALGPCRLSKSKKYTADDRFHRNETVRMAKFWPRKNQSQRSDLPCHIIICFINLF